MNDRFRVEAEGARVDAERPGHPRRSAGVLEDFEVIWSGAKQRAGECPGLSGYDNRKGIANARKLALCAPEEWTGKPIV